MMKPGVKTTEFWLVVVSNVLSIVAAFDGVLPLRYSIMLIACLNGVYAVLRTLAKQPGITTLVEVNKPQ